MSISTEEKDRYLRETAIVLAREGFQTGKTDTGKLRVLLDGAPLCEVTENGGITYRNEDINEPERVAAKDMVYEIVRNTAEYMRQMETAPFLKADGLEDGYKVLADFNGTVLAGVQSNHIALKISLEAMTSQHPANINIIFPMKLRNFFSSVFCFSAFEVVL